MIVEREEKEGKGRKERKLIRNTDRRGRTDEEEGNR